MAAVLPTSAQGCDVPAVEQPPAVPGAGDTSAAPETEQTPAVPGAGDTSAAPAVEQPPAVPGSDTPAADPTVQPPAGRVPSDLSPIPVPDPRHRILPDEPGHGIPDGTKGPGGLGPP